MWPVVTDDERRAVGGAVGVVAAEAVADAMWRKESLGTLLWALGHLERDPAYGLEFEQQRLDEAITRYGTVDGLPHGGQAAPRRPDRGARWLEADAWLGATEGRAGRRRPGRVAAAERFRALSWLRDRDAAPA